MTWHVEHATEPSQAPSRSISYSFAMSRRESPSEALMVLRTAPLASLKVTSMLWVGLVRRESETRLKVRTLLQVQDEIDDHEVVLRDWCVNV